MPGCFPHSPSSLHARDRSLSRCPQVPPAPADPPSQPGPAARRLAPFPPLRLAAPPAGPLPSAARRGQRRMDGQQLVSRASAAQTCPTPSQRSLPAPDPACSQLLLRPQPLARGLLEQPASRCGTSLLEEPETSNRWATGSAGGTWMLAGSNQGDVTPSLRSQPVADGWRCDPSPRRHGLSVQNEPRVPQAARDPLSCPNSQDTWTPSCCPPPPSSISSSAGLGSSRL